MTEPDMTEPDATALAAMIRRGDLTAVEAVDDAIARALSGCSHS
ncbi:hypothetical protein [Fodinicola feengrottensis]|nr:hypothetical protein [Fodinicola feengrottensis]